CPKQSPIVGGGYIGLELGTVYAALGTEVSVVEMTSGLMPGVDRDLVRVLQKRSEKIYKDIMLDTRLMGIKEIGNGVLVELEKGGKEKLELVFDRVLVSVGRKPNSEGLGLEHRTAATACKR